jgi:hypothetical protein
MKSTVMKVSRVVVIGVAMLVASRVGFGGNVNPMKDEVTIPKSVLILGSVKTFSEAESLAKDVSSRSGVPYSTRGMIYDKKKGLIYPKDFSDELYRGSYYGRRSNDECEGAECISIERSEFYSGFEKGYYVVVGGLYDKSISKEGEAALAKFKKIVPDAYAKKTEVYMGCLH